MALCKKYSELSHQDKVIFIGQVVHAIQNCDDCFEIGEGIVRMGLISGLYTNVVINPASETPSNNEQKY